jgi:hypothetical protein
MDRGFRHAQGGFRVRQKRVKTRASSEVSTDSSNERAGESEVGKKEGST